MSRLPGVLAILGTLMVTPSAQAGRAAAPMLLGQTISDSQLLSKPFCRTYHCRVLSTSVTGTGSGNAEELNDRATDVALSSGLTLRLLRSPSHRLLSATLISASFTTPPRPARALMTTSADFFRLTLGRQVTQGSPELQACAQLFALNTSEHLRGFWTVRGTSTGSCLREERPTPTGRKTLYLMDAELP